MNNRFLLALATLVGTIIGGGIFGVPYVMAKSGLLPALAYLVVLGGVVLLLHLMFGEIALATHEKHRLIGYAHVYLGGWAKILITISTIAGTVGALLAYIILGGQFLALVLGSVIPFSAFEFSLVFWFFCSAFVIRGIQAIARMELLMNIALFAVVGGIFAFAAPHIQATNVRLFDVSHLLVPYGVVLFAFWGLPAIPEIADLFKNKKDKGRLDNLIVWSSGICGGLFLLFGLFVVGVSGEATSQEALPGLVPFLGANVVVWGGVFGLLAVAASFLVLGNYLKNSLRYDYHMPLAWALGIALFTPALLFIAGLREFIVVLGIVGAVIAVLEGSVVALIWRKLKAAENRIPEYRVRIPRIAAWLLIIFLVVGAFAEMYDFGCAVPGVSSGWPGC